MMNIIMNRMNLNLKSLLDKQKELEAQFKLIKNKKSVVAYDLNQDLLLIIIINWLR